MPYDGNMELTIYYDFCFVCKLRYLLANTNIFFTPRVVMRGGEAGTGGQSKSILNIHVLPRSLASPQKVNDWSKQLTIFVRTVNDAWLVPVGTDFNQTFLVIQLFKFIFFYSGHKNLKRRNSHRCGQKYLTTSKPFWPEIILYLKNRIEEMI